MIRGCALRRAIVAMALAAFVLASIVATVLATDAPHHSNPWLLSWIPATCCVTNDCCWEISERELRSLPDDEWEVRSTGQVRKRTAFSPDGKFYRCACDYDNDRKVWNRHQGANTRCIFVPMRSASAPVAAKTYPTDGSDEDNTYAKFSPAGELTLTIANPALLGKIEPGTKFYLDFIKVE